jgi:hypothetical protein
MSDLKIKYRNPAELNPYKNNARTHSDVQVEQIASSIQEFGFVNPILIDGAGTVIAGHGRLMAALSLKLKRVPVLELGHLSERQRKALILADNKIAMNAGWDLEKLSSELSDLSESDFDLSLIGFDEQELAGLLQLDEGILPDGFSQPETVTVSSYERSVSKPGLTDDDDTPELVASPVARFGDVWVLGNHRLMCGDSLNADTVSELMAGVKAVMVFTDPPYNVKISGLGSGSSKNSIGKMHGEFKMASGEMSDEEFTEFLYKTFSRLKEVSTDGAIHYVCMDWKHAQNVLNAGQVYETREAVGGGNCEISSNS